MTEQQLRAAFVAAAEGWVGRKESDGSHREIIDLYNTQQPLPRGYKMTYKDDWCAAFVTAAAIKAGLTAIIPMECSCNKQIEQLKQMGCWEEDDAYVPQPGDLIYYDWDDNGVGDNRGVADHVGIVTGCDGKDTTVIEGNKNDAVGYRKIAVNGKTIRGYGRPNFAAFADKPAQNVPWWQADSDWVAEMGISDGQRAGDPATRAEVWAMLHRTYNKLKEER